MKRLAELLWNNVHGSLQAAKKFRPADGKPLLLGNVPLDDHEEKVLSLGPKYCLNTPLKTVEQLALTQKVERFVADVQRDFV